VAIHDISVTKYVDASSPNLMLPCCNGKHIKEGSSRTQGRRASVEYLKIKLTDILIFRRADAGHGSVHLTESVT